MKKICIIIAALLPLASVFAVRAPAKLGDTTFNVVGNYDDFTQLPVVKAENKSGKAASFKVKMTLTDKKGNIKLSKSYSLDVPAKSVAELKAFDSKPASITDEAVLFRAEIIGLNNKTASVSGIFGKEKPVPASVANVFAMNVHLGRYTPEIEWKLLRLLKDAGITSVRVDGRFAKPSEKELKKRIRTMNEVILGLEAFGIRPMTMIGYFPREFYRSPDKMKMAYVWAGMLAKALKGRTDWHYGNETNSGWAAFGEARAMAPLNKAFALGTASQDPSALKGSFGIAGALENYVREFIKCDTLPYLDALCIHPYCGTPEAGMVKSLAAKKMIKMYGSKAQVWATEIGFHVDENSKLNELTGELTGVSGFSILHQRQLLPRMYVLGQSYGIERVYWYDFFGLRDRETFWIVDKDYKPLPAYKVLKECSKRLKDTVSAGYTPVEDLVQRHVFKRKDGSILLACWALKNNVKANFRLPSTVKVFDDLGKAVKLPENGSLTLGHGLFYVEGLTSDQLPKLINKDVLVSALDKRYFNAPMYRFTVKAGSKFTVPFVAFNGTKKTVAVKPLVMRTFPGWKINVPDAIKLPAGENEAKTFDITVPAEAVPGVEYIFTFGADVNEMQMAYPYTVRVKVAGDFPYTAIERFNRPITYPMWDAMDETKAKKGNPELAAKQGKAVIDGNLKEWKAEEFYPIDQKFQWKMRNPGIPSDDDWSGKIAMRWDSKYIYVAFLIKDEHLCFMDFLSRDWRDNDNIRLFFSSIEDEKKRAKRISDNDLLLIMTPTGISHTEGPMLNVASLGGKIRPKTEGKVKMSSKVWQNGYVLEVAVPVKEFNLVPKAGMVIGFNCMADDIDDGFRQHVAMTYYKNGNYWNCPQALGKLKLIK